MSEVTGPQPEDELVAQPEGRSVPRPDGALEDGATDVALPESRGAIDSFPDDVPVTRAPTSPRVVYLAGDDPRMVQVEELCYRTLHEPFGVSRQDDWDNMDPASIHLAAVDGDQVIGYARLIVEGRWGHVRQVVVRPEYRRQGVARALMDEAIGQAARMRLRGAYLNARLQAVGLYERAGFKVVSKPFAMPRTFVPHVRMERRLP